MGGLFNYDNPIWGFVGKIWDVMVLNILWFICCLPIVTIGASNTALLYCANKILKDESSSIFLDFIRSFRDNFVKSTLIWIGMMIVGVVLIIDIRFFLIFNIPDIIKYMAVSMSMFLVLVWIFMYMYIFALVSRFDLKLKELVKLGFILPIKHIFSTIGLLLSNILIIAAAYMISINLTFVLAIFFLTGAALMAMASIYQLNFVFEKYVIS